LRHPLLRPILALLLALAAVLPAALPASAREPYRPLPNYRPEFVTERERGTWNDCLWASASMLIDKWSAGRLTVSKDRLRRLSGDRHKGSSFDDLARSLRKVGLPARWSPEGGDFVTWRELKQRLAKGGGAILLGDYSDLPRWYARWDPKFWRNDGADDNHAIYLDRYDGRRDRFWVMDPLAPAGWGGEWVPARYLRAYAWQTRGGGLWVLMTPAAQRAPFANVRVSAAKAAGTGDGVVLRWEVERSPKGWKLPKVDVLAKTERLADPVALAPFGAVSVLSDGPTEGPPAKPSAHWKGGAIVARVAAPTKPGAYRVSVALRERRFGRRAVRGAAVVFVPGERRGTIVASGPAGQVEAGSLALGVLVVNTGSVDWSDPEWLAGTPHDILPRRNTTLRATWTWLGEPTASGGTPAAPAPADVLPLPLEAGESTRTGLAIPTPGLPGTWALTLDIVDRIDGSFATGGSAPTTILVELVSPTSPTGPHP
jgi:hypothetical protein